MKPERNNKDNFRRGGRDGYRRPEPRQELEENENQQPTTSENGIGSNEDPVD